MVKNYFILLLLIYCLPQTIIGYFIPLTAIKTGAFPLFMLFFAGLLFLIFISLFLICCQIGSVIKTLKDCLNIIVLGIVTLPIMFMIFFGVGFAIMLLVLILFAPFASLLEHIGNKEGAMVLGLLAVMSFAFALARFFSWFSMIILRSRFVFSKERDREFSFVITSGTIGALIILSFGFGLILSIPNIPIFLGIFIAYFLSAMPFSFLLWRGEKSVGRENFWPEVKLL